MADDGYGNDPDTQNGFYQQGGTVGYHQLSNGQWVPNDIAFLIEDAKARKAKGERLSAKDEAMLADPDKWFMNHGNPEQKTFVNQHQGLVTLLSIGAVFVPGGIQALSQGARWPPGCSRARKSAPA